MYVLCVLCSAAPQYYYVLSALTTPQWSVGVIQQEGLIAILKVEKHGLVEKPLPGAIFEVIARRTYTNVLGVQSFGGIMQVMCVGLA